MSKIILVAREDDELGGVGLGFKAVPASAGLNPAADGLLLAHDLVEHVNGVHEIGTIDDELEALGGIWYTRGQWGEMRRDGSGSMYTPEQNIAADASRMFRDFFYGAAANLTPLRTRATDHDDSFAEILACVAQEALGELDSDEDMGEAAKKLAAYLAICMPRMRTGFRKAAAKFEKHGHFAANNLFWEIAETVAPYCKCAEVGQEFALRYGFKDGSAYANMTEIYPKGY